MLSVRRAQIGVLLLYNSEIKTRINNGTYKRTQNNSSKKTESIAFWKWDRMVSVLMGSGSSLNNWVAM